MTLFNAVLADFPDATLVIPEENIYKVNCSIASQPGTVDFGFGNTIIHVPYHEFIWFAGPDVCALGVVPDEHISVLGGKRAFFFTGNAIDMLTKP